MAAEEASPSLLNLALARNDPRGPQCSVRRVLQNHPQAEQIQELLNALPLVQYSTAAAVLKDAGIELKADVLSRHTRRECSCPK